MTIVETALDTIYAIRKEEGGKYPGPYTTTHPEDLEGHIDSVVDILKITHEHIQNCGVFTYQQIWDELAHQASFCSKCLR